MVVVAINHLRSILKAKAQSQFLAQVFKSVPEIKEDSSDLLKINSINESLVFKKVTFICDLHNEAVLNDVSFTIEKGNMIAFLGMSARIQETVIDLITLNINPRSGDIFMGDVDIRDISPISYLAQVEYVKDVSLDIKKTIKENLLNANPEATEDDLLEALTLTNAHKFVHEKLINGINTMIENKDTLSLSRKLRLKLS